MLYFTNPVGKAGTPTAELRTQAMRRGELGFIGTPRQGNRLPEGVRWCADNGCFSERFNEAQWWAYLTRMAPAANRCEFAVAPDVVGDAAGTLERSRPWLAKIRELGYPVAYVAQDGFWATEVPWDEFDVLFIGGSTEFKLGPEAAAAVAEARRRGMQVHMGRVNSRKRMAYAQSIGCTSVDGTYAVFGPEENLPKLLRWSRELAMEAWEAQAAA